MLTVDKNNPSFQFVQIQKKTYIIQSLQKDSQGLTVASSFDREIQYGSLVKDIQTINYIFV